MKCRKKCRRQLRLSKESHRCWQLSPLHCRCSVCCVHSQGVFTGRHQRLTTTHLSIQQVQSNILRSNFNALTPRLWVSAAAQETSGRGRRLKFWGKQKTTCCAKPMSHLNWKRAIATENWNGFGEWKSNTRSMKAGSTQEKKVGRWREYKGRFKHMYQVLGSLCPVDCILK